LIAAGASMAPRGCSTIPAACGSMGRAMASDVRALDDAFAERERVIRTIRTHQEKLREFGVSRLWLFGSVARGDAGRRSDVDVLISVGATQDFSLLDLAEVRAELCELLGRDTDVVIREDVLPHFWETIRDDLVAVF
jgi:predicted nucleotidyltransferase